MDDDQALADDHRPPVVVARHPDRGSAEVSRALLVAAGLDAELLDEVEGGSVPVDGEPGVGVAVPANQSAVAEALLRTDR